MRATWLIRFALITYIHGETVGKFVTTKSTLEILHVLFRHGDRAPDSLYPNDPYTENDFYPIRKGQLTNKGKMTEFKVGTSLRRKYKTFIPDVYTPEIIQSVSSHYPRTRASLELVLAGLFPPTIALRWNNNLAWQPIPYDYLDKSHNLIFLASQACPRYQTVAEDTLKSYKDPVETKYRNLLPFLQNSTGLSHNSVTTIGVNLYSTLKSEVEFGLKLPAWATELYPDTLSELSAQYWVRQSIGDLKTLTSGFLVSHIINNTKSKLQDVPSHKDTKVYLYSGHDLNVAGLLIFLDNFAPHNPNYGAYIIIEVHNISGNRYLKFLYENYEYAEPKVLKVPSCGIYCPLKTFIRFYAKHLDPSRLSALCG